MSEVEYPRLPGDMVALVRWRTCVAVVWHAGHPTLCARPAELYGDLLLWAPNHHRRKCFVMNQSPGISTSVRAPRMPVCGHHYFAVRQEGDHVRERREGYEHVWWPAVLAVQANRVRGMCPSCGCGAIFQCTLSWDGNEAFCAPPGQGRTTCSACALTAPELRDLGLTIHRPPKASP
jgi:hypothetical protein